MGMHVLQCLKYLSDDVASFVLRDWLVYRSQRAAWQILHREANALSHLTDADPVSSGMRQRVHALTTSHMTRQSYHDTVTPVSNVDDALLRRERKITFACENTIAASISRL